MGDKKAILIKEILDTRIKYHEIITNHDFTDSEKDILLQASVNVHRSKMDETLINEAYNILISKSIISTIKRKNSATNSPYIKYLLIFGFLSVLFYIMTPNEFEGVNKVEKQEQKVVVPKQKIELLKFGNISGQGFLRTQGGSVRTCAGNEVYIERSNPNGLLYLSELLQNKIDHLASLEDTLDMYKDWLRSSEDRLRRYSSRSYMREYVNGEKQAVLREKQIINKLKKKISLAKKVVQEYEEKVGNSIKDNILKTMCDAQGNYEFPKVALGKYYIRTIVQWYVGDKKQGGIVSKVINVHEGHNKIMLTE